MLSSLAYAVLRMSYRAMYEYGPHHPHSNAARIAAARWYGLAHLKASWRLPVSIFLCSGINSVGVAVYLGFNTRIRVRGNEMAQICIGYDKAEDIHVRDAQLQRARYRRSSAKLYSVQWLSSNSSIYTMHDTHVGTWYVRKFSILLLLLTARIAQPVASEAFNWLLLCPPLRLYPPIALPRLALDNTQRIHRRARLCVVCREELAQYDTYIFCRLVCVGGWRTSDTPGSSKGSLFRWRRQS